MKKNIIASYISQAYVVMIGILVLPFYIVEMGAEAYGLVGFFAMLQSIFNLLDLGLTPTISRETACYRAGTHSDVVFRQLYRTLNIIFLCVAFLGGSILYLKSEAIASSWLNVKTLKSSDVIFSIQVMAICIALRWMTGLYRGLVNGYEKIVWLSSYNSIIATLRFLVVFPVMWLFGSTPDIFFSYQLGVAIIEFISLLIKSNKLLPSINIEQNKDLVWSLKPIKPFLKFSLSIALTSGLWVVVTQTDKLLMSKLLSLEEYGYFTLAVLVATGIKMISGPISGPIMPRMVKLEAEGKRDELIKLYINATQLIAIIAGSVSIMMVFFAKSILWVWTGDEKIVETSGPTLQLYAVGYGLIAVSAFPYYLQYALGKLKLHIIGSVLFVGILLPTLWNATQEYGMVGAGYAWIIVNTFYFIAWTAYVHNTYIPRLHLEWLTKGILKLLPLPIFVAWVCSNLIIESSRIIMFLELSAIGILIFISSLVYSELFLDKLKKLKGRYA